ncbi:MAG: LAGLIDADG family homing endonuclease, partial [Candidatus Micrarchaeota archaeon]
MAKKEMPKQDAEIYDKIETVGNSLLSEIDKNENPHLSIPIRGRGNVFFDEKTKKIVLGDKVAQRYLFNVSHARSFMQTMLVASYVKKDLLENNLTATLRDLYYAKKRTIKGTKEDTIDEQKESDMAIVDFEVSLDTFRERLHLRAEPKGRMAGDLVVMDRVRDKVDRIDLSRMGSGGWAVPSIVEQIEFKDVGVEYVLVAEKNAIFDRLNEDGYWQANKCLLMTTAGQAARGARRLLQRLSSELKLPIYCLSVDAGEPVLIMGEDGLLRHQRIGEYANTLMSAYGLLNEGYYERCISCDQAFQITSNFSASPGAITQVIRHPVSEDLFEIVAEGGASCRVTKSHSLMVFDAVSYSIQPRQTSMLRQGNYLVSPSIVPNPPGLDRIDWVELIKKSNNKLLASIEYTPKSIRLRRSRFLLKRMAYLDKSFCRLLGYYASEGSTSDDGVVLTFGPHEQSLVNDAVQCAKTALGLPTVAVHYRKDAIRVTFGGKLASKLFAFILACGTKACNKSAPDAIFNAPSSSKKEFLRGCFMGDGCATIKKGSARIKLTTTSRKLAADVTLLIRQLGGISSTKRYAASSERYSEYYAVFISDKHTLSLFDDLTFALAEKLGLGKEFSEYFKDNKRLRVSKFYGVPKELVAPLADAIRKLGGTGIGRLLESSPEKVMFHKLRPILNKVSFELGKGRKANAVVCALPRLPQEPGVSLSDLSLRLGINKQTVNSCLRRLAREGCAIKVIVDGKKPLWWRGKRNFVEPMEVAGIASLKEIVENELLVLPVKEIKRIKPTNGFVYDLEVLPSHTFLCGIGSLCAHNTDADPYGWYIYSTMKYGSMALAHESDRLGCKEMKFIGMSISDIEHYKLDAVTIKAKEVDIKRANEIKEYDWFKTKEWQNEIRKFLDKKIKAEIQALSSKNLQYISKTYLPDKIN